MAMESEDGVIRIDLKPVSGASAAGGESRPHLEGDKVAAIAYARNLSLDTLLREPIKFSFNDGQPGKLDFLLYNDDDVYLHEQKLCEYHTKSEKSDIRYNPRLSIHTAWIKVIYDDYDLDQYYSRLNHINLIVRVILARLLTFFQRRRVTFGFVPAFPYKSHTVWAGTSADQVSLVDSVGWGKVAIDSTNLELAIRASLERIETLDDKNIEKLSMLLLRYNETLNLVYAHERAEALWRILEAIGYVIPNSDRSTAEYERLRLLLPPKKNGAPAQSALLKLFINALLSAGINYNDDIVIKSWRFRNSVVHHYLDQATLFSEHVPEIFNFLNMVVESVIFLNLNIPLSYFKEVKFWVSDGIIYWDEYTHESI